MGAQYALADDTRYVEQVCSGDMAAFEALLRRYERQIYGFIYHLMGGDADDAADLLQETFIKVYRALPRLPADVNFSAWLYRVARNCCLDEIRRRQRARGLLQGETWEIAARANDDADPEAVVLRREGAGAVAAILARMSSRNRQALILREFEGLSCEEIGVVFGISRKAVKSMLFRAREEFRRVMLTASAECEC